MCDSRQTLQSIRSNVATRVACKPSAKFAGHTELEPNGCEEAIMKAMHRFAPRTLPISSPDCQELEGTAEHTGNQVGKIARRRSVNRSKSPAMPSRAQPKESGYAGGPGLGMAPDEMQVVDVAVFTEARSGKCHAECSRPFRSHAGGRCKYACQCLRQRPRYTPFHTTSGRRDSWHNQAEPIPASRTCRMS